MEEIWKYIEGTNQQYEVSNHGRVRSNRKRPKILTLTKQPKGYLYAMIEVDGKPKNCRVHRLVATHFISNPEGLAEVNHKDGNKENNHVSNLEWMDHSANNHHAYATGLRQPTIPTSEQRERLSKMWRGVPYAGKGEKRKPSPSISLTNEKTPK